MEEATEEPSGIGSRYEALKNVCAIHAGRFEDVLEECKEQLEFFSPERASEERSDVLLRMAESIWKMSEQVSLKATHSNVDEKVKEAISYAREALGLVSGRNGAVETRLRAQIVLAHVLASQHRNPSKKELGEAIALYEGVIAVSNGDAELFSRCAGAIGYYCERYGEDGDAGITFQSAIERYSDALAWSNEPERVGDMNKKIATMKTAKVERMGKQKMWEK